MHLCAPRRPPRRTPAWLLLLAASPTLAAAPSAAPDLPGPRAMTLPEALVYAREHQPAVKAALARVQAAEADARSTRAQWMPYVGAAAQLVGGTANNTTASYLSVGGVDLPRIGGTPVQATGSLEPYPSTVAAIGLTQQVFDFGRIAAQAAVDDAITGVQRLGAEAQALFVALGVEEAFFAVQAARNVLRASEDAFERAIVHRQRVVNTGEDSTAASSASSKSRGRRNRRMSFTGKECCGFKERLMPSSVADACSSRSYLRSS